MIRVLRFLLRQPDERVARLESLLVQREEHVRMLRRGVAEAMIALMAEHQARLRAEALLEQREEMRQ